MKDSDPLPFDIERIAPSTFVGEVVMKAEFTPLLRAAMDKGCPVQVGTDMLFEQIPAYLEFFGYGTTTADVLRATPYVGRQVLLQDYCSGDYFAEDYTGSWVWVPS